MESVKNENTNKNRGRWVHKFCKKNLCKEKKKYGFNYEVPGGVASKKYRERGEGVSFTHDLSGRRKKVGYIASKFGGYDLRLNFDLINSDYDCEESDVFIEYSGKLFGFQRGDCACKYSQLLWKYLFRLILKKEIYFDLRLLSSLVGDEINISWNPWGWMFEITESDYMRQFLALRLLQYRKNKKIKPVYGSYLETHNPKDNILYNFLYDLYKKTLENDSENESN